MALAYSVVGVPLLTLLWLLGGQWRQLLVLGTVIVLAVLALSFDALKNRFSITYATGIVPAIVCGLSHDIAGVHGGAFATMLMCTVGLSSLHERVETVVWAWLSCTVAWVIMLLVGGQGDLLTVLILSWTYAVAAAILFAKAEHMRRLHEALKAQAHAVEVATRAKTQFLAAMSHELRTPLNGVIGTTELMQTGPLTLEQRESLHTIRASADWLLTTVSGVLDYARAENGALVIQPVAFEPRLLAEELVRLLAPTAHHKGLEFIVDLDEGLPCEVIADSFRLRQVVMHLVSNAIKFTVAGEVRLKLRAADGRLCFVVEDTGIGIAPADLPRIFEAFTQLEDGLRRRFDGTGLGLTLAREVTRRLNGELSVQSELGLGTSFTFTVPAPVVRPAPEPNPVLAGRVCAVLSNSPGARKALERVLVSLGGHVGELAHASLVVLDVPVREPLAWLSRLEPTGRRTIALVPPAFASTREFQRLGVVESVPKPQPRLVAEALVRALHSNTPVPVVPEPPVVVPLHAGPAAGNARWHVLIAEDNPVNARVLVRLLERLGVQSEVVINGVEALKRASDAHFDAVFMDVNMPEMDGLEATRVLRARGFMRPIIAVTARSSTDEEHECRRAGMSAFLSKPVNSKKLEEVVEAQLQPAASARA